MLNLFLRRADSSRIPSFKAWIHGQNSDLLWLSSSWRMWGMKWPGTLGGHTTHWLCQWTEAKLFDLASQLIGRSCWHHPFLVEPESAGSRAGGREDPRARPQGSELPTQHASFLLSVATFLTTSRRGTQCPTPPRQSAFVGSSLLNIPEMGTGLLAMPGWTVVCSHPRQASHFPQVLARLRIHQIFYSSFKCSWTTLDIPCNQTKTILQICQVAVSDTFLITTHHFATLPAARMYPLMTS